MNPAIALTFSRIIIAPFFACAFIVSFKSHVPVVWLWISVVFAALSSCRTPWTAMLPAAATR